MNDWFNNFLLAWIPLLVVMDPIGLVPIFLGITHGMEKTQTRRIALQASLTACLVAVGFLFLGKAIFKVLGITVADFQIAGGLILLVLATRDMLGGEDDKKIASRDDIGVVPLGLPLIAGPALITTLLLLVDSVGLAMTLTALSVNLVLIILAFVFSEKLRDLIGITGLRAISKIIALLLAAIAVSMIHNGWKSISS